MSRSPGRRPIPVRRIAAVLLVTLGVSHPSSSETIVAVPGDTSLAGALTTVPEGGIIEIAAGSYPAPAGGWGVTNLSKSFTIRGVGTVSLNGQGLQPIFKLLNNAPDRSRSLVFENLRFVNGRSTQDGIGGGVTLRNATATFIDCEFSNNTSQAPSTGGGAAFVFADSWVHFVDTKWIGNTAKNEGAGLRVDSSSVFVHGGLFDGNSVAESGHRTTAAGGGIHVTSSGPSPSILRIGNSRFVDNRAGFAGGAIFAFGDWNGAQSQILIVDSTFEDNVAANDPGVSPPSPLVGGAIHGEDNAFLDVRTSRFLTNSAENGGAISGYRSQNEIWSSSFRGNLAYGSYPSGFGGAIALSSEDANDATTNFGATNRPSTSLLVRDTLFQGRYGGTTFAGNRGGCLSVSGDINRTYGLSGVSAMGTAATNRAPVLIFDSVFYDCDVRQQNTVTATGAGGGMDLLHVNLHLTRSLIVASDAVASTDFSWGGGMRASLNSKVSLVDSTFAYNSADTNGGAAQIIGGPLLIDGCQFFGNSLDGAESSAMHLTPGTALTQFVDTDLTGSVESSTFADNDGLPILEWDNDGGPINDLVYLDNVFHPSPGNDVFRNLLAGPARTVAELNGLTVVRSGSSNTQKYASEMLNAALDDPPSLAALLAAPPVRLSTAPPGEMTVPTRAYQAFAWSGGSATLDGDPLGSTTFDLRNAGAGTRTLLVDGSVQASDAISFATTPGAALVASPVAISSGQNSTLSWETEGFLLDVTLDRGATIPLAAAGNKIVSPAGTRRYHLLAFTDAGSAAADAKIYVDEPASGDIFGDGFESGATSSWSSSSP